MISLFRSRHASMIAPLTKRYDVTRCYWIWQLGESGAFATAVASHTRLQCLHNQSMAALPDGRGLIIDETEPTPLLVQLFCQ